MTINLAAIENELKAANIPFIGLSNPDSILAHVIVQFDPSATQQQRDAAAAIIAAFVDPDIAINANNADIIARWKASAVHGKTPAEIYTLLQGAIDGWSSLAQAKADLRVWLPLLAAALAWTIFKDQET